MSIQNVVLKIKAAFTTSFARTAVLVGIIAAVAGPFLMLTIGGREANNLPWYIWIIIPLVLLIAVAVGFLGFKRDAHDAQDISISPNRR